MPTPAEEKLELEIEFLKQQIERLSIEVGEIRAENVWTRRIRRFLPMSTGLIGVAAFCFGVIQFIINDRASREDRAAAALVSSREQVNADRILSLDLKRETAKPLWDRQLGLYIEATEKAALIATTEDKDARKSAEERFWVLYWGPLAAVEDVGLGQQAPAIEAAMVAFGKHLKKMPAERDRGELEQASLNLAHSIRQALAPAFDIQVSVSG